MLIRGYITRRRNDGSGGIRGFMEYLLLLFTGAAAGALIVWGVVARRVGRERREAGALAAELESLRTALNEQERRAELEQRLRNEACEREKNLREEAFSREKSQLTAGYEEKLVLMQKMHENAVTVREEAFAAEKAALVRAQQEMRDQFQRSMEEMEKTRQAKHELLREEFKTLSEKILEEKSGKLQSSGREMLAELLNPFRDKLTEFRTAVEESKLKGVELHSALVAQLGKMMEETGRIGGEARSLTRALKGEQKVQGDWGEIILEDILERSGLRAGIHYESQETLRDASGQAIRSDGDSRRLRPDVIVHYPDGRDVVIDSKVSLTAYVDYCNCEDEEGRREALSRHVKSVRAHVEELAKKNYAAYLARTGRDTVDFVVMFVPNEGPFHLAMIENPALWGEAFRQKVLIVSPVNLMALLRIIQIAWTREEQNRNQQEILDTAAQLLERLYAFYSDIDDLGRNLDKARDSYESAVRRLKQGERSHSIVNSGEKLRRLGVKMRRTGVLPPRLRDEIEEEERGKADKISSVEASDRGELLPDAGADGDRNRIEQ